MDQSLLEPRLTEAGISFMVNIESTGRPCLITRDALSHLCHATGFRMDPMNTYRAFEARINSVARRLVFTGSRESPLVLEPRYFP